MGIAMKGLLGRADPRDVYARLERALRALPMEATP
jgi:hypothetical protein